LVEFFERTKPRHRRFAGGGFAAKSSSSVSKESMSGHSMVGKAMDSSTCWEACANALMSKLSKEPIWWRDRFKFVLIMGFLSLVTAVSLRLLRTLSRASLAGDKLFVMSKLDMVLGDGVIFRCGKFLWNLLGILWDPPIDFSIIRQQLDYCTESPPVAQEKEKRKERNIFDGIWSSLKLKLFCEQQTSEATRMIEF
jgi:hypothetical protein